MNCIVKTSALTTRAASAADLDKIINLLHLMADENAVFSPNFEKVRKTIMECIGETLVIVMEKDDEIIGCCALSRISVWYSDDPALADYVFFLHPSHRTFHTAITLINACKGTADVFGVPLMLGVYSKVDAGRKMNLFARAMTPMGGFFMYKPEAK